MQLNMPSVVQAPVRPWTLDPGEGEPLAPLAGALDAGDGVGVCAAEEEVAVEEVGAAESVDVVIVTVRKPEEVPVVAGVEVWAAAEVEV